MQVKETRPLYVLVTHGEQLLAAGLRYELEGQPGIAVLSELPSTEGAVVDVVIGDYTEGISLCSIPRTARPAVLRDARVLIATSCARERSVRTALRAGAFGYIQSACDAEEVVNAVRTIGMGGRHLSPSIAQRMAMSLSSESLTDRESEVLELLAHGSCNKDIARLLGIALGTVKAHVKGIMNKLEASSRTHAASIASERGLLSEFNVQEGVGLQSIPAPERDGAGNWFLRPQIEQALHA